MEKVEILRGVIPPAIIERALRLINSQLYHGLEKSEVDRAIREANWFPWIRESQEIVDVAGCLPDEYRTGQICNPQIILRLPHVGSHKSVNPHVDEEPPWADGRKYSRIVGVALSRAGWHDGGLYLWKDGVDKSPTNTYLVPGDAIVMRPDVLHSPGINYSGNIRYALYFRWLKEKT